jgi:hypothetical protein
MGTLATAIITKELDSDKAVALTAVSTLISTPMALAAAVLAVENAKGQDGVRTGRQSPRGEETMVPPVVGLTLEQAETLVTQAGLKSAPEHHVSRPPLVPGLVYKQVPAAREFLPVGRSVKLSVASGPPPPGEENTRDILVEVRDRLRRLDHGTPLRREAPEAFPDQAGVPPPAGAAPQPVAAAEPQADAASPPD